MKWYNSSINIVHNFKFLTIIQFFLLNILSFCLKTIIFIISIVYFGTTIPELFVFYDTLDDISNNHDADYKLKKKVKVRVGKFTIIVIFTYTAVPLVILIIIPKTCEAYANYNFMCTDLAIAILSTVIFFIVTTKVLIYNFRG